MVFGSVSEDAVFSTRLDVRWNFLTAIRHFSKLGGILFRLAQVGLASFDLTILFGPFGGEVFQVLGGAFFFVGFFVLWTHT
jgi:hypothetical protein